ncbi:MAG: thiamine phosphate synthase [Kiritimatiellae bacterium]|nr:thiamine phosphate synthase [Kiritimatiellia bacterium]
MQPSESELHTNRMQRFGQAGLYFVTSEPLSAGRSSLDVLHEALDGGVRLVQLREKTYERRALTELAIAARDLTDRYDAILIVNDYLDIALAADADGVHLGQQDLPVAAARRVAPDLIIGASSHTREELLEAQSAGASYVNIGPLFPTKTKEWLRDYLGIDGMRDIAQIATVPFTVMGGIKTEHISDLVAAGAQTIALVTAISAQPCPRNAATALLAQIQTAKAAL